MPTNSGLPVETTPDWFYFDGTQSVGPFTWSTLEQLRRGGIIHDSTQVCAVGGTSWNAFGELVQKRSTSPPNALPPAIPMPPAQTRTAIPETKFEITFGSFFLGSSGAFRGDGTVAILPEHVEICGVLALPALLDSALILLMALGCLVVPLPFDQLRLGLILLLLSIYTHFPRRSARFALVEIGPISRAKNRITLQRQLSRKGEPLKIRAKNEQLAQAIEVALRQAIGTHVARTPLNLVTC